MIFYFTFSILPRQRDLKKIKPQIEFISDKILWDGMFIVTEMTHQNISQSKYYEGTLTIDELSNALKDCFYDTKLKNSTKNSKGEQYDIGDFVSDYLSNINNNVEQLLRYIIFLDPEFISIINELQRNKLFEAWDNVNQWRKITINGKKYLAHTDLSKNSKWLFEFYKTMQKLEIYLSSNYYSKIKSYRNKATRAYFDFDDYLQAIEYNKKILKINKSDKYALFYLGASYIKILQIDKGVEYLKKALEIYPDFKPFIKSNIKNKNAVKQVFQESD